MILSILSVCFDVVASENINNNQHKDVIKFIAPYVLDNNEGENISRGNCVATIMKLVGVDEETADEYANSNYHNPVFLDSGRDAINDGYIILAKFSGIAMGVDFYQNGANNFAPNRNVTVRESLTFMLRCLTTAELVSWDNIIEDSIKYGLLQENELEFYVADAPLQNKQFYTLLHRMLDKKRYLYWPIDDPSDGYAKSMQVDKTNSIRYINWILENNKGLFNY